MSMNRVLALQKMGSNSSLARSAEMLESEQAFLISSVSAVCPTGLVMAAQN
jgi:hypothetical protein